MSVKRRWFGTDGIRGEFGQNPMTTGFARRVGLAAARFFASSSGEPCRVVVGRDTRMSGTVLEEALVSGLAAGGAEVTHAGVVPTAAVAALVIHHGARTGVMISASHNPARDNGIKFFDAQGFKLADGVEAALEEEIGKIPPTGDGFVEPRPDFELQEPSFEVYEQVLRRSLPGGFHLRGMKIVADCAHGAAWRTTPRVLAGLGAEVRTIGCAPDGLNINEGCGSQEPALLQEAVRAWQGSIGLAHDGDADRLVLVDETGVPLDGDEALAIAALDLLKRGELSGNTVVATSMSNLGLDETMARAGGRVLRTDVGDRYVLEAMKAGGYVLGGEQSGHMVFLEHFPTGDGLLSALQILRVLVDTGRPLSELRRCLTRYPQKLVSLRVREKIPLAEIPAMQPLLRDLEARLAGQGRLVVRYSGTENKIRLLIEAGEGHNLDSLLEPVIHGLRTTIGAT